MDTVGMLCDVCGSAPLEERAGTQEVRCGLCIAVKAALLSPHRRVNLPRRRGKTSDTGIDCDDGDFH